MKQMKKWGGEVCIEYMHATRYEMFLKVNEYLSEGMQAEAMTKFP